MKAISLALALATALAVSSVARADTYNFSFSGGGLSGSGVIETSSAAVPGVPGAVQITGITGTFSDTTAGITNALITGLQATGLPSPVNPDGTFLPPGTDVFSYDNLLFPGGNSPAVCPPNPAEQPYPFGGGLLDIYGMLFNVEGGYSVDLWSNGVIPGFGLTYGVGDAFDGAKLNTFGEPFSGENASVSIAATPEPGSFLLLGTGILGFAGSLARKLKRA
jgi:hypothetical protein